NISCLSPYTTLFRSYNLGLASPERKKLLEEKIGLIEDIIQYTRKFSVKPQFVNQLLTEKGTSELKQGVKLYDIILRPQISIFDLDRKSTRLNSSHVK